MSKDKELQTSKQVYTSPEVVVLNIIIEGCLASSNTSGSLGDLGDNEIYDEEF